MSKPPKRNKGPTPRRRAATEEMTDGSRPSRSYQNWAPTEWAEAGADHATVLCYRMARVGPDRLPRTKFIDLGLVRAVLVGGALSYMDINEAVGLDRSGEFPQIDAKRIRHPVTSEGAYLFLMSPFDEASHYRSEGAAQSSCRLGAALFMASLGFNVVYARAFDMSFELRGRSAVVNGPIVFAPSLYDPPDVSERGLGDVAALSAALDALPENEQRRARLALDWYLNALHDDGARALLGFWIALETLAMPNTYDIKPLVHRVADIYGLEPGEANEKFKMGRIYRMRGRIVHDGERVGISPGLQKFIDGLFVDVLRDFLHLPPQFQAASVAEEEDFDLEEEFR